MKHRSRIYGLVCLVGFLACLGLAGLARVGMRRSLGRAVTTFHTPLSGAAVWEGGWEISEQGADPSEAGSQSGADRVVIPFVGTDLALRVRRGDYRGYFFVSVDGEPANLLPQEQRGAYLVLTSPDYTPQIATIPVASGLDDGPHEAVIVAERGWDQWPLVGWSVSRTPDTTLYRWGVIGSAVIGLVCLSGAIRWGAMWQRSGGAEEQRREGDKETRKRGEREHVCSLQSAIRNSQCAILIVVAATFYFSPWLPLTLVSGLALAVLVLMRIDLGLALVAATAPFYLHPRPLFGKAFSMAELLMLLCAFSWGVRRFPALLSVARGSRPPLSLASRINSLCFLDLAVLFFVCVSVVSAFGAAYRHVALRELRVVVLEPAFFYLMLRTSRLNGRAVWWVVDLWVLGAVVVALVGLVQYGLGVNLITAEQGFRRLRSVYGSPNNAGLYLGRVLPVLVSIALFGGPRSRNRRIAYGAVALPVGLAVLLSFSKGALILGVPISLVTVGILAGGRWLWVSLGAVTTAIVAAVPLLRTPRFASLLDTRSGTTFFRLQLWRSSWMMFRDHPWLGVGLDNFLYQYRSRYILPSAWQEPDLSHPHNLVLDYGCRLGGLGLVAGLWLQVAFWRLALPLHRLSAPDRRALAIGLMGSMVNFVAHGLVDASYFVIDLAFVFFLTLGVIQWLQRRELYEFKA